MPYRKDFFIPWTPDIEKAMVTDSICSICDDMRLYRVELRISPKTTLEEMVDTIKLYDCAIKQAINLVKHKGELTYNKNFFYTLHFPKADDKIILNCCRHYELKKNISLMANTIIELRRNASKNIAERVLGIDACSHEIDCRPEVFAPTFRYLQDYEYISDNDNKSLRQLKVTYHVAEDNYDIIDALRAIHEAILFLSLRSGSRLGHATLLGVSAENYYSYNNPVHMPRQEFLDNIVWMYYFMQNNCIAFDESNLLTTYLNKQFWIHFSKIYDDDLQGCFVDNVLKEASESNYLRFPTGRISFTKENFEFDMYHYYLAWLLRGDEPELYKKGFINHSYKYSESYKICDTDSDMEKARRNFEANYLYHLYHYSERVKIRGKEIIEEVLPDYVIRAISMIQTHMKKIISDAGIGIETNPTSNVFISIINNYSEHPISNFYGLNSSEKDIQLNISINTDDKSTFSTCLSNEYAYLLYYLEHKKDSNGNYMYSRFEIMQWLDEIRKMGNDQSFAN